MQFSFLRLNILDDCLTAGGHYNPYNVDHGGPTATERHEGDFGNVVAAGGK